MRIFLTCLFWQATASGPACTLSTMEPGYLVTNNWYFLSLLSGLPTKGGAGDVPSAQIN